MMAGVPFDMGPGMVYISVQGPGAALPATE
jgi:hypothetical protein